jgi:hypothetical protein
MLNSGSHVQLGGAEVVEQPDDLLDVLLGEAHRASPSGCLDRAGPAVVRPNRSSTWSNARADRTRPDRADRDRRPAGGLQLAVMREQRPAQRLRLRHRRPGHIVVNGQVLASGNLTWRSTVMTVPQSADGHLEDLRAAVAATQKRAATVVTALP